jgi:lipopolysaccharide heptosyltransferase II
MFHKKAIKSIAARPISSEPSILIILMGSLGDVARGLGLISHIKTQRPLSRIAWLVEPKCAGLVGLHPQIDNIIIFKRAWSVNAVWDMVQQLRKEPFDITLDLQRHLKSGFFAFLSNGKRRIGFHRKNAKESNWIFNNEHIDYFSEKLSKLQHYFKFLDYLGFPEPVDVDFGFSQFQAHQYMPNGLSELRRPLVAVLLGSRWESKNWFVDGYIQLVQRIMATADLQVALLGDRSQAADAQKISESVKTKGIINLVGKTSLAELTAVLKLAAAAIGPDSGPGHLAAAVGTPYVALFGPTSPKRTAPYGCEHLVVQANLNCIPCYKKQCPEHTKQCMHAIGADDIMEKLSVALSSGLNSRPAD